MHRVRGAAPSSTHEQRSGVQGDASCEVCRVRGSGTAELAACSATADRTCQCQARYNNLSGGTECTTCAAPASTNSGGAFKAAAGGANCEAWRMRGSGAAELAACSATANCTCQSSVPGGVRRTTT